MQEFHQIRHEEKISFHSRKMATKQTIGTLYTYAGNYQAYKAQIAAQYSGAQLTVSGEDEFKMNETNRSEAFLKKFPTGKVPAFEDNTGLYLFEANAIAHYLSNDQLRGATPVNQAKILQWIEYGEREINPTTTTLVYPCMGILQFNKNAHEHAKERMSQVLQLLDNHLRTRTYLVGERITLADIAIACDLLLLFQWIIEPGIRNAHNHVTRWFVTLINQKEFQAVLGNEVKLCEKTAQFDGKKYAELNRQNQPTTTTTTTTTTKNEGTQEGKKKKEKQKEKENKPAPKEEVLDPVDVKIEDETDEILADEPKQKDPFADMPKSNLNMDEFKRVYSNQDTATVAIPYFWDHFDKDNCSIWFCEYKYPEELTQIFMTCNLIAGFFQRLDKLRKNAFGSMCVLGENNNNTITGIWVWRGQDLAFKLSPDWQVDYESYEWKRLDVENEQTKQLVNQYLLWEGVEHNGKKFNQGKIFK